LKPSNAKKKTQLGIDPGTAAARLIRDLLFDFVGATECFRCGEPLTRESFSVDHKVPWLDSENPPALFFDLKNISYSHLSCNVADGRRPRRKTPEQLAAMSPAQRREVLYDREYARLCRLRKKNVA
jgi:HNH endonuclease